MKPEKKSLLYYLVHLFILRGWFTNVDKFKKGDFVKYNWKAKAYIKDIYNEEKGIVFMVDTVNNKFHIKSDYCSFAKVGGAKKDGCDAFWLRKCYFWEKH